MGAREAHRAAVRGARRSRTSSARELGVGEHEFWREVVNEEASHHKKESARRRRISGATAAVWQK